MKNEKGVTLTVLTITILIMIIITGTVIKASTNSLVIRKVNDLFTDIESINSKIATYYLENNEIPVLDTKYASSVEEFRELINSNGAKENIINPNDGDDYYVIDLSRLENLTLNFGHDYENWKSQENPVLSQYQDIYVINGLTQQIYYPKGIQYKNIHYFTTIKDIAKIDRIAGYVGDADFGIVNLSSIFNKNKQENGNITVTSNVELSIDTDNYVVNSLSYAFTEEQKNQEELNNLSYSKFYLNNKNEASLVSKRLDRLTQKYYLYIRTLDVYGKYHYLEQPVDRLENAEAGWVLADDKNEDNDWYQYLDTSGADTIATVNAPILAEGMEAVKYEGEDNMDASTISTLTSGSRWANAVTKDGSMWVWIPRYAYRITSGYHQSGADINPDNPELGAGTIEIAFVDKENHFLDKSLRGQTILTGGVTDETYTASNVWILEPAFEFGDEHLTGFWFAKFEASNTDGYGEATGTANNTNLTLQIKPNARSWTYISSLNSFSVCQQLRSENNYNNYFNNTTNVDTHMMKNVEWGAMAYLAHSKYGLNGQEVYINNYNGYITGLCGSTSNSNIAFDISNTFKYNSVKGINASITKNIYGIYDISGGAWDNVAACFNERNDLLTDNTEQNFINKYIDKYDSSYSISKYGDGIYETSNGIVSPYDKGWLRDYALGGNLTSPLLTRGGNVDFGYYGGKFAFSRSNGNAGSNSTFRPAIAVTETQDNDFVPNMPEGWTVANSRNTNNDWYQYKDTSTAQGAVAEVNAPKLASGMTPIKYVGEEDTSDQDLATLTAGSKWANAITKDGSMWVWIPRYAYRITSGYHQSGADINPSSPTLGAGTIEIAFLDTENNFLDPNITGTVVTNRSRRLNLCRFNPMDT